ncbi:MAG TPA: hypothetical protein VJW23_11460 [Propionibacteriaceae bacterium]|nr:hypothetical protein [Propionibacteriaceae bacterium]
MSHASGEPIATGQVRGLPDDDPIDLFIPVSAVQYAGLVGLFIRMERPSTAEEKELTGEPTVGMEAFVIAVSDGDGYVTIHSDYGETWRIGDHDAPLWKWTIWESETTRRRFKYPD